MHAAGQKLKSTAEKRASMLASRGNAGHFCSVDRAAAFICLSTITQGLVSASLYHCHRVTLSRTDVNRVVSFSRRRPPRCPLLSAFGRQLGGYFFLKGNNWIKIKPFQVRRSLISGGSMS